MPESAPKTILVDYNKCISCGICVQLCPHDALELKDGVPVMVGKCKVCGLCSASCITKAISMAAEKFTDEGLLDTEMKDIVVFTCRRNVEKGKDYNATVISLLCSARLDPYLIAEAFSRGARAVLLSTCGNNCRNYPGSAEAKFRLEAVRMILEKLGEDGERVKVVEGNFEDAIEELRTKNFEALKNADILKNAVLNRDLRAIIARMRGIVEEGNVYGEKIDYERYMKVLEEAIDRAVKFSIISKNLNGETKVSEIVSRTGLSYGEVLSTILEMKRKGLVEVEVEEEVVVKG